MRKTVVYGLAGAMLVASALPATAGEVNGKGEPTPIRERAGSICAFSGLNDDPDDPRMFEGGRVQSFGDIVQEATQLISVHERVGMIRAFGPGVSCRGYASGGGGGAH